jgi:phosphohistidine phosphatase
VENGPAAGYHGAVQVVLVHHGEAVPADVDAQRPLSEDGLARVEALAREAARRGAKPAVVWHSGKLRARQTADAFRRLCNPLAAFGAVRGLQPTDPATWIVDRVFGEPRDVMLVGHQPNLTRVLSRLVHGADDALVSFPPHGVVALGGDGERDWRETWRLPAE